MSKERELLKRFMTELNTEEDVVSLFNDIKECLAQPEQEPITQREAYLRGYAAARKDYKQKVINAFGVDDE